MTSSPMPAFVKLLAADVERSVRFYGALGFTDAGRDGVLVHLRFGEHAHLYVVRTPPGADLPGPRGAGVLVCFTCPDVDALAARARETGAPVDGPRTQPWHTRETVVTDPDGYRVVFVQPA
ncbi:MAG: VOC family protein [Deltaproteobacteria bacterium]|nr:VOC family protein [Deltaproteobacteria bacterium]